MKIFVYYKIESMSIEVIILINTEYNTVSNTYHITSKQMNVQDRRRILGPNGAKPLAFADLSSNDSNNNDNKPPAKDFLIPNITTSIMSNANGSCIVETPQISLLTSIHGPRSTRSVSFESRCEINVILKSDKFQTDNLKELSSFIVSVLESCICVEKYPKSGIDIFVNFNIEELPLITSYIPYLLMSIVLAIVDADIEISDLVAGSNVNGNVICFGQNGDHVVGIWKDEGSVETDSFGDIISQCQEQYLNHRHQIINYLQTMKKDTK